MRLRAPAFVLLVVAGVVIAGGCKDRESTPSPVNRPAPAAVTLGCVTSLTGEGATYGLATRRGVDLALAEINGSRAAGKPKINVVYEDDRLDATAGRTALQKLIAVDRVPAVLGAFGSSVTLAIAPIAEQNKVVLFSASSTADEIKSAGDYIFRNVPTNRSQGATAARFVHERLKAKTAAILRMNNDYGQSLADAFESDFANLGGRVVIRETYSPGVVDFRGQLAKIAATRPDVVFYPGHYQESGLILKQARQLGLKATFVGGDGSYSPTLVEIAGEAAEGSYYTLMAMASAATSPDVTRFTNTFKAKYNEEPDVYAAYAYDAIKTIVAAADQSGYTAEKIKNGLYATDFNGITGRTKFDADGEVAKPFAVYKVTNGSFERQ